MGGDSSELDYGSLRLGFAFGTLGSFAGAGLAANTGGGLLSSIGFSTAFEGAFAGGEQIARNFANGDPLTQDVSESILSSIIFQGISEILSNGREILQVGGRFLRAGDNLLDDVLRVFGGRRLATPDGVGDDFFRSVGEVPNGKGGNKFAASTDERPNSGDIPDRANSVLPEDLQQQIENLPTPQQRAVRSLSKRAQEHRQKLEDFKANPDAFDNKGFLQNAPNKEVRQRIIDGRIRHLEQEIRAFETDIQKIIEGGN